MEQTTLIGVPTTRITTPAELVAAGYLARYSGSTRETYRVSLKLLFDWCGGLGVDLLEGMRRPVLELFARYLEDERKNSPATVAHHLSIIRGFYAFAEIDQYIERSPAAHLRMPRVFQDESRTMGLDRMELGSLIQTARASCPSDAALITLMGMLGLRVSEACAVRIEDYQDIERGHRVLRLVGKGGKPATIPLPVPVLRAMDAAAGDRASGPLLLRRKSGQPVNRKSAALTVERLCKQAGIKKRITPHGLRHSFVTACLDAGVPLRDVQVAARHSDPRITARYDRARHNHDRHASHVVAAFLAGAA
ncbi:tyrosine-type recombinase/integrase [Pseudarthrobacter equi]|uniref:tyrosine-type recombinase/integrase n=1 Tax=Pseudarthrobacter equi TaxID=728066 RepID=UPI0021C1BED0|nr:tyrosine-type recombinase/integrase [Pseudarthrobacter equi]MCT9624268.1 tyrosine-type recombinase/integrase [Pseudarthrobacter equi]